MIPMQGALNDQAARGRVVVSDPDSVGYQVTLTVSGKSKTYSGKGTSGFSFNNASASSTSCSFSLS